jgi:hypothetical protein
LVECCPLRMAIVRSNFHFHPLHFVVTSLLMPRKAIMFCVKEHTILLLFAILWQIYIP